MPGPDVERDVTPEDERRVLALLPTTPGSEGTPGMPEGALVRIRGEPARAALADLAAAGLARQLPGGGWVATDDTPRRILTTGTVRPRCNSTS